MGSVAGAAVVGASSGSGGGVGAPTTWPRWASTAGMLASAMRRLRSAASAARDRIDAVSSVAVPGQSNCSMLSPSEVPDAGAGAPLWS